MKGVSTFRLYLLRATYLLIVIGLGVQIWPGVLNPAPDLEHMRSAVRSLLAGVSVLALFGIRYPLQMLPILVFELVWKAIWLIAFGLPRWSAGTLSGAYARSWGECLFSVVLLLVVLPWPYLWEQAVGRLPGRQDAGVPVGPASSSGPRAAGSARR